MRPIEESFNAELIEKFEKLVELLFTACPDEFATPETTIFKDIEVITKSIEHVTKNFKNQLNSGADEDFKFEDSNHDDVEGNRRLVEYTQAQMASFIKIKTLEQKIKIKEDLLNRKCENQSYANDDNDNQMDDLRSEIQNLDEKIHSTRSFRKQKIEKLTKELINKKKKYSCWENFMKQVESDRKRIEDLKTELTSMKQERDSLIRSQRTEGDQYKKWIKNRDKEINILIEKDREQQNEVKRIERMHEKQQSVLKRKVEESKAANKRLQDAMDCNKKVQEMRNTNKNYVENSQEVIQNCIHNEIMVLITAKDAEIAMRNLDIDRKMLIQRLINLKNTVNKTKLIENEMKQIEQELEMLNTTIRAKVLETDTDGKLKIFLDNFNTLPELRTAMGSILRELLSAREEYPNLKTKTEDLRVAWETSEKRFDQLTEKMQKMKEKNEIAMLTMECEFERNVAFLNMHNKEDLEFPNWDDKSRKEVKHQLKWMTQQISNKTIKIRDLNTELSMLEQEGKTRKLVNNTCKCKGRCATRLCTCKKEENFCIDTCKCSDACINCPDDSEEIDDGAAGSSAVEKENGEGIDAAKSPKKMDFENITTPDYPLRKITRKALSQIQAQKLKKN